MGRLLRASAILIISVFGGLASGQVSVLTQHNDVARTGQNPNETILNTSNVTVSQFGKLFARTVDGQIYAQPLYLQGLAIGGKTRNVVFVATEHNSVYAFDADDPTASTALWQVNLGTSVPSGDVCVGVSSSFCPYVDMTPEIGITATPVIDPSTGTIYVVAKTKNTSNSTYHFNLHALDVLSGAEKFAGPVEIAATNFKALNQHNRPGLLLLNGMAYAAFGSVGDVSPWHGWIFGFNSSNLSSPSVVFNATPNGCCGGIWGGGGGLAADVDNIYAMTGNGNFDANTGGSDYGDSVLKLSTSTSLGVADYFTPDDQATLFSNDTDLGSGNPLLLPGTSLLVAGGKDGILRLINTGSMGKFNPTFNADVQEFQATAGQIFGSFVYANSPSFGPAVYLWGSGDKMKAWAFNGSTFNTTPVSQGTLSNTSGETTHAPLSISSNQNQTGSGIVWTVKPAADPGHQTVSGTLYAFDANNLSRELWDSSQNASRDALGNYAKFCPPTIANGKVYMATFSKQLVVYGLLAPPTPSIRFMQVNAATPQSVIASVSVPYASSQNAADLNIVVVGWNDTTSSVSSVTDKLGNVYTLAVGPTTASGARQSIYYAKNIKGGSNTVNVAFNQAAAYPDIRVLEYAGADTTNPLDVTAAAVGSGTTANSGSATTTAANDLIVGADTIATGTPGPGTGFIARIITTHDSDLAEDKTGTTAGSYSATAPLSPSGYWVMQMAAFKLAGTGGSAPAPTVSSVSPSSGPTNGGTAVTITGANFAAGATVTFGGTAATNVNVASSTSITATTPANAAGAVSVVVTNTGGQSGTLTSGFTYTAPAPTVSSVSPNSGSTNGGTAVTIAGSNFAAGATVTFGGTAATNVNIVSSTSITATTPAHAAGTVNVVVTNTGGQSGTLSSGFTYTSSTSTPISFVQVAAATPQTASSTVSVAYKVAQTAGDLNIVVVGWNDTTSSVNSLTDTLGNTYSLAVGPTTASGARQSIYYAKNIKGGSNTVTVAFNQAAVAVDLRVLEYKGLSPTSPLDVTAAAVGSSTTASSGSATTTSANELIFGADTIATGTPGPGTGFTTRIITSPDSDIAEDKIVSATGAYSATAPVSPSGYWVMQMATFRQ